MRTAPNIITFLFLIVMILSGQHAYGQKDTSETKIYTEIEALQREIQKDAEKIKQLTDEVQNLKTREAVLTKSLDTQTIVFGIFGGFISVILLIGTITSFINWNTDRKRSSETYHLALQKEKESSKHDRGIFSQSTNTLTLVNQTLRLAKDASERASKALEKRFNKRHNELEQESIDLIDESKAYKNFKILVENPKFRSDLLALAKEIAGLQNNLNMLEEEETKLHPYCSFIRGMEYHLDVHQNFKSAIKYWKQAKDHKNAPSNLQIMALYWIGYEQNNLKEFGNATSNFELAASISTGALKYELERIKIESKSFDFPKISPDKLIPEMEALYDEIKPETTEEFQKVKSSIAGTLGNIYYQLGNSVENKTDAPKYYKKAKDIFYAAPIKNKWIWFGYGEACYKLGEHEEAGKVLLEKVKTEAELEYSTRLEPRTKVLGQTTLLICSMRVESLHKNVTTIYNTIINSALGDVDERLTVYSQIQRRNVDRAQFRKDLDELMREFESSL